MLQGGPTHQGWSGVEEGRRKGGGGGRVKKMRRGKEGDGKESRKGRKPTGLHTIFYSNGH